MVKGPVRRARSRARALKLCLSAGLLALALDACASTPSSATDYGFDLAALSGVHGFLVQWKAPHRTVLFDVSDIYRTAEGDLVRYMSVICIPDTGADSPYFAADYMQCDIDVCDEAMGRGGTDVWTLVRPRPGLCWVDVGDKTDVILDTEPAP